MKAKISIVVLAMMLWACTMPMFQNKNSESGTRESDQSSTLLPSTKAASRQPTSTYTKPSIQPSTTKPGKTPTRRPTETSTKSPIRIPTNTPLPPLPDFPESLSFGGAGSAWDCYDRYPQVPDGIYAEAIYSDDALFCIYLQNVDQGVPIRIQLSSVDGSNIELWSNELVLDRNIKRMYWRGQGGGHVIKMGGYVDHWESDGSVKFVVGFWWPVTLPPGTWRATVHRAGVLPVSTDFQVHQIVGTAYINVIGPQFAGEPMPQRPLEGSPVNFLGVGFPPSVPVYLLVYNDTLGMRLVGKQQVLSDESGRIRGELSGPFGQDRHVLYGVSDQNGFLETISKMAGACSPGRMGAANGFACDWLSLTPTSCPGAPLQRMITDQRGYICTKGDSVPLQDNPERSANTIDSLQVGTWFTVIRGPACADNWSWWQILTDSGLSGWISEGGNETDYYFICVGP